MIPPPPTSTLFPYTTLFRSQTGNRRQWPGRGGSVKPHAYGGPGVARGSGAGPEFVDRDRKSTRLNSSHVSISYAVFCLKKKKLKWVPPGQRVLQDHYRGMTI